MTTRGCSNLTIAYLQHRLYSPVTPAWCGPALHLCADPLPPTWLGRVDRVECSPESLALCHAATPTQPSHDHAKAAEPAYAALAPRDCNPPPPIYERPILLAVLTPVVQGSMLDIVA